MGLLINPRVAFALAFTKEAMALAKLIQSEVVSDSISKSDDSPVTIADFSIQALFGTRLAASFPGDDVFSEEDSAMLQNHPQISDKVLHFLHTQVPKAKFSEVLTWIDWGKTNPSPDSFWTLDPIDGTKGYLRGEQYCVALSFVSAGEVQFAVLGCPELNEKCLPENEGPGTLILAVKNQGCWSGRDLNIENFHPLKVSATSCLDQSLPMGSIEKSHSNGSRFDLLLERMQNKRTPLLMDSMAKYASLAAGHGDFFIYFPPKINPDHRMKIWDVAPGALVVEEAGGKITDIHGSRIDFTQGASVKNNPGIVVSNGKIHDDLLNAIRAIH